MREELKYRWLLVLFLAVLCFLCNPVKGQYVPENFNWCKVIQPEHRPLTPEELQFISKKLTGAIKPLSLPYVLPVVVHIVHVNGLGNISDAQVISGINSANIEFSNNSPQGQVWWGVDMEIQFCLANEDPNGLPTTGIVRYDADTLGINNLSWYGLDGGGTISQQLANLIWWNPLQYFNVVLVTEINDNAGGFGIQGYAYIHNGNYNPLDGIYQLYNTFGTTGNLKSYTNLNKVFVHELGHAWGLPHTFDFGGNCNVDADSSYGILDTPATTGQSSNNLCNLRDCNNTQYIENYMDYTHQNCQCGFTQNQKDVAHYWANNSFQRYSQLTSGKCQLISTTLPDFTISEDTLCVDEWVQFGSVTAGATTLEWTMPGGVNTTANTITAYTYYTSTGNKSVTLKVNNSDSITKQVNVIGCPPIADEFAENHFGDSLKLRFTTNRGAKLLGNSQQFGQEAAASICNSSGAIQYYSNGKKIYNGSHTLIQTGLNGSNNSTNCSATQSGMLSYSGNYYLFPSSDAGPLNSGFRFYNVTSSTVQNAFINYADCEGRTFVRHGDGVRWWVIGKIKGMSYVAAYLFDGDLSDAPVLSISHDGNQQSSAYGIGQIKSNRDGTMVAFSENSSHTVYLYNFDRCTGILTYNKQFQFIHSGTGYSGTGYGCAFDHTGDYIYTTGNLYLMRWHINSAVKDTIATGGWVYTFAQLELAPNDTVYVARLGLKYLSSVYGTSFTDEAVMAYSPGIINCRFSIGNIVNAYNLPVTCSQPLPIELLSFEGENRGDYNLLEWVTASEKNNDRFLLEKSYDLKEWFPLAEIPGAGNSSFTNYYSFKDVLINDNSTYYYRLWQVDFDGTKTLSQKIVSIYVKSKKETEIIYNVFGQIMSRKIEELPTGIYIIQQGHHFKKEVVIR